MSAKRDAEATRQQILDALKEMVASGGYFTKFTLSAVAKAAGVSKGGLLHHFPSKKALMRGLTEHLLEGFEERLHAELERQGANDVPGRWARAYVGAMLGNRASSEAHLSASLLAFVGLREEAKALAKAQFDYWQELAAQDGLPRVDASLVLLATNGILYTEILNQGRIEPTLRQQLIDRLIQMTCEPRRAD